MKTLNEKQIDAIENLINNIYGIDADALYFELIKKDFIEDFIYFVFEKCNHEFKFIFIVMLVAENKDFKKLKKLKEITEKIVKEKDANIGYYLACYFDKDNEVHYNEKAFGMDLNIEKNSFMNKKRQ
jgi:hypothetical protein